MEDLILIGLWQGFILICTFILLITIKNDIARGNFYGENEPEETYVLKEKGVEKLLFLERDLEEILSRQQHCRKHNHSYIGTGCRFCWSEELEETILKQFKYVGRSKTKKKIKE